MGWVFPALPPASSWSGWGQGVREVVLIPSPIADIDFPPQLRVEGQGSAGGGRAPADPLPTPTLHSTYSDQRRVLCRGGSLKVGGKSSRESNCSNSSSPWRGWSLCELGGAQRRGRGRGQPLSIPSPPPPAPNQEPGRSSQ